VGDHSLEYYPIVLKNVMKKINVNLLDRVPKQYILNFKNLHVVTHSGDGAHTFLQNHKIDRRVVELHILTQNMKTN